MNQLEMYQELVDLRNDVQHLREQGESDLRIVISWIDRLVKELER